VAVAEARPERREVDPLGEQAALLAQVAHRVVGERLERLGHPPLLLGQGPLELGRVQQAPAGEARAVAEDARAAHGQELAVADFVEQRRPRRVDQPHAAADEEQRPRIREASGLRVGHVHDDAHARLDQLLRRDAVEVGVVDDCDVVRGQPADEVLRLAVEARVTGELDEAHRTRWRNSRPPSIRSISPRRSSSSSSSIRVTVGSPGTFSTRK
jgi:hypothetical protein